MGLGLALPEGGVLARQGSRQVVGLAALFPGLRCWSHVCAHPHTCENPSAILRLCEVPLL